MTLLGGLCIGLVAGLAVLLDLLALGVIQQLVQLMTKMNEQGDDNSSVSSKDKSSPETKAERRSKTNNALKAKMEIELHDRKELAKENRRLAESAGEMLHTLIMEGKTEVKKVIISAIIDQWSPS